MRRKVVKIILIVVSLMISFSIPIIAVSAKKKNLESGPIYIDETISGFMWANYSNQPWLKGSGTEDDPYMIKNLEIDAGDNFFCMLIMNSEAYFKIMDCTFSNTGPFNSQDGRNAALILVNTQNGVIFKNEMFNCGFPGTELGGGIALVASSNNKVQKNYCHDNELSGIYVQYSNDNVIRQNLCTGNTWGIFISEGSSYNEVTNNDCSNNIETGIHLFYYADYNVITNNDCKENIGSGITLSTSNGNIITLNNCSNNGENGIFLVDWYDPMRMVNQTANNILYRNYIENNLNGIHFLEADKNDVFRNNIKENDIGMIVEGQSAHNLIYQNNFIDNEVQASNEHAGLNNWHSIYMLEGNFWSDYDGPDEDVDGIGDEPWPWWDFDVYPFMAENGWEILSPIEEEILNARIDPDTNRLGGGRDYRADETGYLIVGLGQLFSERTHDTWIPPYTCRLWFYEVVNNEVVEVEYGFQGNLWYFEEESYFGEPLWRNLYYLIIPPNMINVPPGEYPFKWGISFYSGGVQQFMNFTTSFKIPIPE